MRKIFVHLYLHDFTTPIPSNPQPIKPFQKPQPHSKYLCQPIVSSCQVPTVFLQQVCLLALVGVDWVVVVVVTVAGFAVRVVEGKV